MLLTAYAHVESHWSDTAADAPGRWGLDGTLPAVGHERGLAGAATLVLELFPRQTQVSGHWPQRAVEVDARVLRGRVRQLRREHGGRA